MREDTAKCSSASTIYVIFGHGKNYSKSKRKVKKALTYHGAAPRVLGNKAKPAGCDLTYECLGGGECWFGLFPGELRFFFLLQK